MEDNKCLLWLENAMNVDEVLMPIYMYEWFKVKEVGKWKVLR